MFRIINSSSKGIMKALHCPFLTRIPVTQVRQYASSLLSYADRCPVMGHVMTYVSAANSQDGSTYPTGPGKEGKDGSGVENDDGPTVVPHNTVSAAGHGGDAGHGKGVTGRCPFLSNKLEVTEVRGDIMDLTTTATVSLHAKSNAAALSNDPTKENDKNEVRTLLVNNSSEKPKSLVEIAKEYNITASPPSANLASEASHPALTTNNKDGDVGDGNNNKGLEADDDSFLNAEGKFDYKKFFAQKIQEKKDDHSYREFRKIARRAGSFPKANEFTYYNRDISIWCSNDYLGMSWHPKVQEAVIEACLTQGCGSGGTRNISGNSPYHEELERELAALHDKEAALLFTSCFVANETTLKTLARLLPGCVIFSDRGNHRSMIEGIKDSGVKYEIFNHNDPQHLEKLMQKYPLATPKLVAFETVHSMTGAVCPLEEICDITHKYGGYTFIDEVHAVGLYGKHGGGIGERDDVLKYMDIISGTLGKAFGIQGGYIAGEAGLVDTLRSFCPGFIFTTSNAPTLVAGTLASLKVLKSEEGRRLRKKHQEVVTSVRERLMEAGLPVVHTPSHILPIVVGNPKLVYDIAWELTEKYGLYMPPINFPTVARGKEMLRIAPTPHHTEEQTSKLVNAMLSVWLEHDLPLRKERCTIECEYCKQPMKFEAFSAREKEKTMETETENPTVKKGCDGSHCCDFLLEDAVKGTRPLMSM